jgi:hypothetical protein
MADLWTRLGRFPGANLAASLEAVLIAVIAIWSFHAVMFVAPALATCFAVYCVARPRGGLDAFMAFAGPAGSAWVFHMITGLPYPALALILLALGLVALMVMDREDGLAPAS